MSTITKKCPMCAEEIPFTVVTCEYCDAQFEVTSTGYCQNCHQVREADRNSQCIVCSNNVIDLHVESRLIKEPAQKPLPRSQSVVQTETPKIRKSRPPIRILAGILIFAVGVAFLWFGRNSIPAVSTLFVTTTATTTFTPTSPPISTSTVTPTYTPTSTPTITPTTVPPYDDFKGTILDSKKWMIVLDWGDTVYRSNKVVIQDERLTMSVANTKPDSSTYVKSIWGFTGDFDIQVDFQKGEGWERPSTGHLDCAILGVLIDGNSYHITQLRRSLHEGSPENVFMAWTDRNELNNSEKATVATISGKLRLIRIGTSLEYLYDIGEGWKEVQTKTVPLGFAKVYFGNASIYASHSFTTYFDNFVINLGNPTLK